MHEKQASPEKRPEMPAPEIGPGADHADASTRKLGQSHPHST